MLSLWTAKPSWHGEMLFRKLVCAAPARAKLQTFLECFPAGCVRCGIGCLCVFPNTTALFYFIFYSSGMSHLFLFPIWLLLSIPDKILSLVRAALWGDGNVFMEGSAAGWICVLKTIPPSLWRDKWLWGLPVRSLTSTLPLSLSSWEFFW